MYGIVTLAKWVWNFGKILTCLCWFRAWKMQQIIGNIMDRLPLWTKNVEVSTAQCLQQITKN